MSFSEITTEPDYDDETEIAGTTGLKKVQLTFFLPDCVRTAANRNTPHGGVSPALREAAHALAFPDGDDTADEINEAIERHETAAAHLPEGESRGVALAEIEQRRRELAALESWDGKFYSGYEQ